MSDIEINQIIHPNRIDRFVQGEPELGYKPFKEKFPREIWYNLEVAVELWLAGLSVMKCHLPASYGGQSQS